MADRLAKFEYKGVCRQLIVKEANANQAFPFCWNDLAEQVRQAHRIPESRQFTLTYRDKELDTIEVDTDAELTRAILYLFANDGKLRFTVRLLSIY
ncbi:hypothetical protein DFS34DRAFT_654511 [Phlyctochytrium arcticum]|nr:hypothetical protein DFS34DRAFT_654511 [Phlyctochytrium arcticum]